MAKITGVRKLPNGKWRARIELGRDANGKRRQTESPMFDTAAEARAYKLEEEQKARTNFRARVLPNTVKVGEYVTIYTEHCQKALEDSTMKQYNWLYKFVLGQPMSKMELRKISVRDIENICMDLKNTPAKWGKGTRPRKDQSVVHLRNFLSGMFEYAIDDKLIVINPVARYHPKTPDKIPPRYWTEDELHKYLEAISNSRHAIVFQLLGGTGARIGEILALTWRDVDLDRGCIYISKTYSRGESGYSVTDAKTKSSNRRVPLPPVTFEELQKHKEKQDQERDMVGSQWEDNDLVCCTSRGRPVSQSNMRTMMNRVGKTLGLPHLSPHGLRHTVATLLIQDETPIPVVAEVLGNDPRVVTDKYAHVTADMEKTWTKKMNNILTKRNH